MSKCNISTSHERDYKFAERTFLKTLAMSSPDAFGANQTYNAESQVASIGYFGVMSVPERYTSQEDVSAGANIPEDREPIYVNRWLSGMSGLASNPANRQIA
jgi:hypothetical protein